MKLYYSGGFTEYATRDEFFDELITRRLVIDSGTIMQNSMRIDGRKYVSNKGNVLTGRIETIDGATYGFNIGGNPIGSGYLNYIQFLEEMNCSSLCGLYLLYSLEDRLLGFVRSPGFNAGLQGVFIPGEKDDYNLPMQ